MKPEKPITRKEMYLDVATGGSPEETTEEVNPEETEEEENGSEDVSLQHEFEAIE